MEIIPNMQPIVYFNQRGAGNGKTYESVQLLNGNIKNTYIYLSKLHSAKHVVSTEYNDQLEKQLLEISEDDYYNGTKQIKIYAKSEKTGDDILIIIGTVDSFIYAVTSEFDRKLSSGSNYFLSLVNKIINNYNYKTTIKYAGEDLILDNNILIIVDEAQDLHYNYGEALLKICEIQKTDVYLIGDKLQSIFLENNIYIDFEKKYNINFTKNNDTIVLPNINIKINTSENRILRFHNEQSKDFVNKIIKFEKYELPNIKGICNIPNCKYSHNDKETYTVFSCPHIYKDDYDHNKVSNFINKIIEYMNEQIISNNYLPEHFMFIFPILTNNYLATLLESHIHTFWIEKFKSEDYNNNIKEIYPDKILKNYYTQNQYKRYVYLHKSEDNKPINLDESEHASRILSIHASKGTGREVVFVLGLSDFSLLKSSKKTDSIIYESLLHVALTRHKQYIYIAIEENNDEIHNRFKEHITSTCIEPNLNDIYNKYKLEKIASNNLDNNEIINSPLYNEYINDTFVVDTSIQKVVIDWKHHVMRYEILTYLWMSNIINKNKCDKSIHFLEKLKDASIRKIKVFNNKTFWDELNKISKIPPHRRCEYEFIPLINYNNPTYEYIKIIEIIVEKIQEKIKYKSKYKKIPKLCPLEIIILQYMIKIIDKGKFTELPCLHLYDIIDYFYVRFDASSHNDYNCKCSECFTNNENNTLDKSEYKKYIQEHYIQVKNIKKIYKLYDSYIKEHFPDKYEYKIRLIYSKDDRDEVKSEECNFNIFKCFDILAVGKHNCIIITIKPETNKLNEQDIIIDHVLSCYLLKNDHLQNTKVSKLKLIHCVISLNNDEPKFYNYDNNFDSITKNIFYNYIKTENNKYFESIFKFFKTYKINEINDFNELMTLIEDFFDKVKKSNLPLYIKEEITRIKGNIYDKIDENDENTACPNKCDIIYNEFTSINNYIKLEKKFSKRLETILLKHFQ